MLAYWRLQLLMKWRGYLPQSHRRENHSKARAVLGYTGMLLLALYVYGTLVWLEMMLFDQFAALGQGEAVLAIALLGSTAVTLVVGFFNLTGQLFFGRDITFLCALPVSARSVLTVKTLMVALSEAGITLLFCAPLVIRLGVATGAGAWFYVKALLICGFVPMIPLALGLLLSFALIKLSGLWKRREGVTTVVSFAFMIGAMMLSLGSQSLTEKELQALLFRLVLGRDSLAAVVLQKYPPLQWANDALLQSGAAGLGRLALFAGVSAAALALVIGVMGKGYLGLAVRQNEALRQLNRGARRRKGQNKASSPFGALLRQELREVVTVPIYATNCLTGVVMFPMMVIIVFVSMQSSATDIMGQLATLIPRDYFLAGAMGVMAMVNGMGMAASTSVSREGKRHDMLKTYPLSGRTHLAAKVTMGMIFNGVVGLTTAVTLWALLPAFWAQTLAALAFGQLFSFLWCVLAVRQDVYHPRLLWKTETEAVKQNLNGLIGMLLCLGMMAVLAGAVYLAVKLGLSLAYGLAAAAVLLGIGDALGYGVVLKKASATYFLR